VRCIGLPFKTLQVGITWKNWNGGIAMNQLERRVERCLANDAEFQVQTTERLICGIGMEAPCKYQGAAVQIRWKGEPADTVFPCYYEKEVGYDAAQTGQ